MYRLLYVALLLALPLQADEVYKSVDEEGNVTYSEEPPADAKEIETLDTGPEPSSEEVGAAQEREKKLEGAVDAMEQADDVQETPSTNESVEAPAVGGAAVVADDPATRRGNYARDGITAPGGHTAHGARTAHGAPTAGHRHRPGRR